MKALVTLAALSVALAVAGCASPSSPGASSIPALPVAARAQHDPAGEYLYVENNNSTISAFSVAADGALTEISGSPFPSQTNGPADYSIAVDPQGPYLYVTGTVTGNIAVFSIGQGGTLDLVSDNTDAGTGASFPLLTKSDDRLYVIDAVNGGSVAAFDLSGHGKKLKSIAGSPYAVSCPGFCDSNPSSAVIGGAYLYTVDTYGWYVSSFSIAKNGALTELNSYATGYGPQQAVITPNGKELYVTNAAQASVSGYSVSAGVLTPLAASPFAAGGTPLGIAIAPNGKHVYAANSADGTITGYAVSAAGLKALPGSPFADGTGTGPAALTVDRTGAHLFVTNNNTEAIAVYAISKSGALSPVPGSPFTENAGASGPHGVALYYS
ncbi:MAG TPA: beta-propeller fold lactonase family protein [Candidatus Cybelea sp.]|jgi:6-phosphogluconolactonase (cycloisomerase 2 family)|nr:beta-propeller fold lactonase family protein [Candidatus Cybelea sp.]